MGKNKKSENTDGKERREKNKRQKEGGKERRSKEAEDLQRQR